MRPIHLQLSGLQSYRESQEIDFARLCAAGVFGIFGPTGSGKSSILDALTLALYGTVERASRGTQAIMNHAETTLSVSFTFELTNAAGTLRYRVERQYKRESELSVKNTISRLVQVTAGSAVVLADKDKDVNQRIQAILGLSMQDFTRAVVLPQGKFAEFLTLTGKDRRQMLQRLFHLEQYGDRLSEKVSASFKEADSAGKQIAAEQLGLGEASQEALEAARLILAEAEVEQRLSRAELERVERLYEEKKQLMLWQREQEALASEAARLGADEADVRAKEELLRQAEQAERARPYVERAAAASVEAAAVRRQLEEAERAQAAASVAYHAAQAELAGAEKALDEGEEPLLLRLQQLKLALEQQDELAEVQRQIAGLEGEERAARAAGAAKQAELRVKMETKDKALAKQADLKEQLKRVEMSSQTRQALQDAAQGKLAVRQLEEQEQQRRGERDRQMTLAQAARSAHEQALAGRGQAAALLAGWQGEAAERLAIGAALAAEAAALLPAAEAAAEGQRAAWRQAERHALAARLAAGLTPGEACPVCGATEHPAPYSVGGDAAGGAEAAEQRAARLQELAQAIRELLGAVRLGQSQAGALYSHGQQAVEAAGIATAVAPPGRTEAAGVAGDVASDRAAVAEMAGDVVPGRAEVAEIASAAAASGREEAAAGLAAAPAQEGREAGSAVVGSAWAWERQAGLAAGADPATDEVAALESALAALRERAGRLAAEAAAGERRLAALLRELQAAERQVDQSAAQRSAAESTLAEAGQRLDHAAAAVRRQREAWDVRFAGQADWDAAEQRLAELLERDRAADELRGRIDKSIPFLDGLLVEIDELQREQAELDKSALQAETRLQGLRERAADKARQLAALLAPGASAKQLHAEAAAALDTLRTAAQRAKTAHGAALHAQQTAAQRASAAAEAAAAGERQRAQTERELEAALADSGFASREAAEAAALAAETRRAWSERVAAHRTREHELRHELAQLAAKLAGRVLSAADWEAAQAERIAAKIRADAALAACATATRAAEELAVRHERWRELEARRAELAARQERLGKLQYVLKANAFVEFLAEEQLMQVSRAASERLGQLTRRRYALEVDSGGGFVIRDDANGGVKRPVGTLSGGETFLTSLALALALSAQIQLKGEYPLEFFFLDEGFGTLDPDLLDMVVGALEKLHIDRLAVGVISHVAELRARLPRKLVVLPAEPSGRGSRIVLEEQ